ncbi:MAG TPA: universal stress protein [Candidatus Acidoferrales bacterium]|nr:universal stress protein [Candidatus Acidoferrales bacterium]
MPRRRQNPHFRKIMIGYDGSKQAEKAAEVAFSLAQSVDCKVLVFAVARPPEPATMVELDAMLDDAREHFEQQFKSLTEKARSLEIECETAIAVGHPVEQIVHRAQMDQIDLIVLGQRGRSRFEKMIVGSTAEKVLRYAHCPVMVVR